MFDRENCFYLGKLTKTQGVKGNLYAFLDTNHPENYTELPSVLIDLNGELIPHFLEFININGQKALVKLEGIDHIDDAQTLVNKELLLPLDVLPELTGNQFYYHEISGFNVEDQKEGNLGKVNQVLDYPNNPLLDITHPSGKEILIPIKDEYMLDVDRENQKLLVQCPDGLLELYLSNED